MHRLHDTLPGKVTLRNSIKALLIDTCRSSNANMKSMRMKDCKFFRERIRDPRLSAAEGGVKQRAPQQVAPERNTHERHLKAPIYNRG